jgi:hypothetical protein
MDLFTSSTYYPQSLTTVEAQTVLNLEALMKGIYEQPGTVQYPHAFTEAESVYETPVISKRIVPTPSNGVRMIYVVAFQIMPGAGFDASGIWNHVIPMAPNLSL